MPDDDNRWLTIPNLLSLSRLALLPLWWWLMASDDPVLHVWGGVLIVYAILSDVADGWIARRWHQASKWGRILDPIGDKLAAFVVALFCVLYRDLPWAAFALTVVRDLTILVGGFVMLRKSAMPPVSADLGRYAALLWGIVLLLYTFNLQPYARYTVWPVVGVYLIAGVHYSRRLW